MSGTRTIPKTSTGGIADLSTGATGTLPVSNGGTGKTSVTINSYLKGNGTSALTERTPTEVKVDLGLSPSDTPSFTGLTLSGTATGAAFDSNKVSGTASILLLYNDYLTSEKGVGLQGPHSASDMAASYYIIFPETEPSANQFLVASAAAGHLTTLTWTSLSTLAGTTYIKADGTVPLTADWSMGNFSLTGKSYTASKVSSTPSQVLLYNSYSTQTTGAGWQGPTSASGMANSYYLVMPEAVPTAGQILIASAPVSNVAEMTWSSLHTINIVSHSASESANAADMYARFHNITGAYTVTLPSAVSGMNATFNATTAAAFSIDCQSADHFVLAGVALTNGNKLTSSGAAGDQVEVICTAANTWTVRHTSGTIIDGGA